MLYFIRIYRILFKNEKMPPKAAASYNSKLFALFIALALLICNTTTGLAGRLAGSLALAAATVLCALAQIAGLNGLDMLHDSNLHRNFLMKDYHKPRPKSTGQTG